MAICERVYGSFIGLVSGQLTPTRATSVKIGTVMSPSPTVDPNNSTAHSESDSWSDIVKKKTTTNVPSTRISLTARPTLSPIEVQKIMKEAAQRAEQIVREALRKT